MGRLDEDLEVEVKFMVDDFEEIIDRLTRMGGELILPRIYERNLVFDNADQNLARGGKLLRLRQDRNCRITFKGRERHKESGLQIREEIEVKVDDFDQAGAILKRIGFEKQISYEKYRTSYVVDQLEVLLDEMPFGLFVELEGEAEAIRTTAEALDLKWEKRISTNYLVLHDRLKEFYDLPFDDVTFENYADYEFGELENLFLDKA